MPSQAARNLFGCYRTGDANDPETYVAAVAAVLAEYPSSVIQVVCDPRTGLPRTLKWLPTVAEIAEACDKHLEWQTRVDQVRRTAKAKRAVLERPTSTDAERREALDWLDRFRKWI